MPAKQQYITHGTRYIKSGEESGDLCIICDIPMLLIKSKVWTVYCRECGREVPYVSWATNMSAYR